MPSAAERTAPEGQGAPGAARRRQANWDRLRILSFADIAAFHMSGQYLLLGTGLPIFLLLRFTLASRLPTPETTGTFIRVRVEKLLLPWAAWSLLFGVLAVVVGKRHGVPVHEIVNPTMLLYGPSEHLWFLPFAAIAGIGVHFLDVATQKAPTRPLVIASVTVGAVAAWVVQPAVTHLATPFRQWAFGLPSIFLGLALGRILARPWPDPRRPWWALLAASGAALAALLLARGAGGAVVDGPVRYALALAMIAGAALLPNVPGRWTSRIVPLLLGGYLLQEPLYQQTVARLERRMGIELAPLALVLLTVPLTLLLVSVLRRTRLRAIL